MSAIGSGIGDESPKSPPSSSTEKRKHAEIGDGSRQSPPPPMEKRERVENKEQLMPPAGALLQLPGDQECNAGGEGEGSRSLDKELERRRERMMKIVEREIAFLKTLGIKYPRDPADDDDPDNDMNQQIGRIDCLSMELVKDFNENHPLYNEYTGFANKVIADFNRKNNKNFCFDDIIDVALCICCGTDCWLTIKVRDPVVANSIMILKCKGKICRGIEIEEEAEFEVGSCELLTLADIAPMRLSSCY